MLPITSDKGILVRVSSPKFHLALFSTGERFPVLLHSLTGQPLMLPTRYVVDRRRVHRQAGTIAADVRTLGYFYQWAEGAGIDLETRLRLGPKLTISEITSFAVFLRSGRRSKVIGAIRHRDHTGSQSILSPEVFNNGLAVVKAFVIWAMDTQMRQDATDVTSSLTEAKKRVALAFGYEKAGTGAVAGQYALSDADVARLLEVTTPENGENPFASRVQHRNYALIRLLLETGLRRGEACKLRVEDLVTGGPEPFIKVVRRPDDPLDKRKNEPAVKTLGRSIPISRGLVRVLDNYVRRFRGRARHPFVLTSSRDANPIWKSLINEVFERIVQKHPEFAGKLRPHTCRRTFSTRLKALSHARGESEESFSKVQTYIMGWTDGSKQAVVYNRAFVEAEAMKCAREMQTALYSNK